MTIMRVIGIQGANYLYAMCFLTVNDNLLLMLATSSTAMLDILHNHPMVTSRCPRKPFEGRPLYVSLQVDLHLICLKRTELKVFWRGLS